ncbi:MAG: hypothetical protein V3U16_09190 [Candidatus Neomarinimicrobiota bacterium]
MTNKFWLAALLGIVFHLVYGFAIFGGLLASYIETVFEGIGRTEPVMWPYVVRSAVIALVMAYMYPKGYKGGTPLAEGFRFGLLIAILFAVAGSLDFYATFPISGSVMFTMFLPEFIGTTLTGMVIAAVYGKIE